MKIRYKNKLYNTDKVKLIKDENIQYGYYWYKGSFLADDGEEIEFKQTHFTNFDNIAYLISWDDEDRQYGSKELKSGVVKVEMGISLNEY